MIDLIFGLLAVVGLPMGYLGLCVQMRAEKVENPPRWPFFFLFGTAGGWLLGFLVLRHLLVGMVVLLVFAIGSALAVVISCTFLLSARSGSIYHRVAFWIGTGYVAVFLVLMFSVAVKGFPK